MYYECKDNSGKNQEGTEENQNKNKLKIESKDKDNGEKDENIFSFSDEFDCRSDPGYLNSDHNQSDNGISEEEKEQKILKRLFTKIEDMPLNKQHKLRNSEKVSNKSFKINNKKKLGFIRSNFYNTFKI